MQAVGQGQQPPDLVDSVIHKDFVVLVELAEKNSDKPDGLEHLSPAVDVEQIQISGRVEQARPGENNSHSGQQSVKPKSRLRFAEPVWPKEDVVSISH